MFPSTKTLAAIAVISATFARVTEAQCVAARTYLHNRPFIDDVITMELWHSGRKVCSERASAFSPIMKTSTNGIALILMSLESAGESRLGRMGSSLKSPELKAYDVENKDTDYNDWCDAWTDNGCKARASSYESCHWISSVCTNGETCNLCDGRAVCDTPP
ncbi:hypothetical protein BKA60DRAFT_544206 [Fusarium oxysporum]|nr:hypothetical protein BKA60DRAFT_544206 [Fusarium oxysporum]